MNPWRDVPTLAGRHVRLEPLARAHADGLRAAAADGELWRLWYTSVPAPDATEAYIDTALAAHAEGRALPFVVRDAEGTVVGSTRFGNVEASHRRAEIGWTWYARRVQRTALNTEAKRLLLTHAFEVMGCNVVQLCTHWHNMASRAAISRLGAKQDGVLRSHMLMPDGGTRDTVVFSIIASEWPAVRQGLDFRLAQGVSA
jgi:RimJ/RimL family protein N-acetyltransferase